MRVAKLKSAYNSIIIEKCCLFSKPCCLFPVDTSGHRCVLGLVNPESVSVSGEVDSASSEKSASEKRKGTPLKESSKKKSFKFSAVSADELKVLENGRRGFEGLKPCYLKRLYTLLHSLRFNRFQCRYLRNFYL